MIKLMCDFDDCLCENRMLDYFNEYFHKNNKLEDFDTYYLDEHYCKNAKESHKFYEFAIGKNVYDKAKLFEHCAETLQNMHNKFGCELYLLTSCIVKNCEDLSSYVMRHKFDFVLENLPFIEPKHIIYTANKSLFVGDIMIDDRFDNLMGDFKIKILLDSWHNRNIDDETLKKAGVVRKNNWKEIEEYLTEVLSTYSR